MTLLKGSTVTADILIHEINNYQFMNQGGGLGGRARGGAAPLPAEVQQEGGPQEDDVHAVPAGGPPVPRADGHRGGHHRRHDEARPEGQLHLQGRR